MGFVGLRTIGQNHVSVADVDRSIGFYRDVIGIPFLFRVPGRSMAFFDCDGVRLYLGAPESETFRSRVVLYFTVQDVDESYAALVERGFAFVDEPHVVARMEDHELRMAFFTDPDGNNLALMAEVPVGQSSG